MMSGRLIVANWKMNGSLEQIAELLPAICDDGMSSLTTVICPPAPYIQLVIGYTGDSSILLGGQNCSSEPHGAFTGEVSPQMLRDVGCRYVILGHSERRQYYGETDELVARKLENALAVGLIPVCCVGETGEEREKGLTRQVISRQVDALLLSGDKLEKKLTSGLIIAYEPVWAIGTGHSASPQEAREVHLMIKDRVAENSTAIAESVRVLYGGSVNDTNARELFELAEIEGALVGGASLDAESFNEIRRLALEV